jgi:hypothetical protein
MKDKLNKLLEMVKYPLYIVLIVSFIIVLIAIYDSKPLIINEKHNSTNVTITESFSNCNSSKSLIERDEMCNGFNDAPCKSHSCCVLLRDKDKNFKCVGGDIGGPTFTNNDYEYYNYKRKCYSGVGNIEIPCE